MPKNTNDKNSLQEKVNKGVLDIFESGLSKRGTYRKENPIQYDEKNVKSLYTSVANKNTAISGGLNLIPGPWAMAAVIPELMLVMKNQRDMIYDIACAMGKEKQLTKELMLGIFASALGSKTLGVLTMHGSKVLVKRASSRVIEKIALMLGGRITAHLTKSMVAKWLPFVGAAAIAAWTRYTTIKIGKYAVLIFSKDISQEKAELEKAEFEDLPTDVATERTFDTEKIKILIGLMHADGKLMDREFRLISEIINKSNISAEQKSKFIADMKSKADYAIDYSIFKSSVDEATALILDMVALAKCDREFHTSEKIYIERVAEEIGFNKGDLDTMMDYDPNN